MIHTFRRLLPTALLLLLTFGYTFAQKPKWVGNTPKELNDTYKFVEIISPGYTLEEARKNAKEQLSDDRQLQEGLRISRRTTDNTKVQQITKDGNFSENIEQHININTVVDGEKYSLQALRIDEYADRKDGRIELHTLYMVALTENPVFDQTKVTTSYGVAPVFMSIIPGVGQWYKGNRIKGASIFASEVVAAAGIIFCDNQRASYVKKAKEQPKFVKEYSSRADNWETGRNVCIGVAAGIWLYNIIDAAVAKGARRIVVEPGRKTEFSLRPMATYGGAGISLAYNF